MTRHTGAIALLGAALLSLTACAESAPPAATPTPAPTVSSTPYASDDSDDPDRVPTPTAADDASQADAVQRAVDALTAFARPELSKQEWINGLTPYLTSEALEAYETVNPANVTIHRVDGDTARLSSGASEYACNVLIGTDAGEWNVALTRDDPAGTWHVLRFIPPGS